MTAAATPLESAVVAVVDRHAVPLAPAVAPPTRSMRRARAWPWRLRALIGLAGELFELETTAALCASSSRPELAYAGRWLCRELAGLAAELRRPTIVGIGDSLAGLRAARENLSDVVTASRAGGEP